MTAFGKGQCNTLGAAHAACPRATQEAIGRIEAIGIVRSDLNKVAGGRGLRLRAIE